jgi:hypothetical protein
LILGGGELHVVRVEPWKIQHHMGLNLYLDGLSTLVGSPSGQGCLRASMYSSSVMEFSLPGGIHHNGVR